MDLTNISTLDTIIWRISWLQESVNMLLMNKQAQ